MTATVAQLAARALRKLGIDIWANATRPAEGAVVASAAVAARVLLELGIPVAEASRPAVLPAVGQTEIASRALQAVGINPVASGNGETGSGVTYAVADIARAALVKLAVIASDETPSTPDQTEAQFRVLDVHDTLLGLSFVSWPIAAIPASVADFYIIMAANLLAPEFGKPANMDAFNGAREMIRQQALSGSAGQALAEAKVAAVHETLNAAGLVAWPVTAVPAAQAESYVRMTAILLAPAMGYQQGAPDRQVDTTAWDAAEASIRKAAVISGAQARAEAKVLAVQGELNDLGLIEWDAEHIPASLADAVAAMAAMQMGPEFGRAFDPKLYGFHEDRVRRVSMGGPAGQALAAQKVVAVHASLAARGRVRWTLYDLPSYAEEPYVFMAAALLAPECDVKADPDWPEMAERELMRIVSLESGGEPVRTAYF
jgi:hypothetical protein